MKAETINSRVIFSGKVFTVRRDKVRLPNGRVAELDIIAHHGAVTMLPIDENGRVWFVRQYRHAAGDTILELPAGTLEPGENPLDCAARELQEEIGMAAERLTLLGEFYLAPGYSTEYQYIYLATGLRPSSLPKDADEVLEPVSFSPDEVMEMTRSGKIRDAKTLAALFLASAHGVWKP